MRSTVQRCATSLPRLLSRTSIAIRSLPRTQIPISRSSTIIRCLHQSLPRRQEAAAASAEAPSDGKVIYTKFQELADNGIIHPTIVNTLTRKMQLETMTEVQSRTISTTVRGVDCIAQAKTGTGKTIAFLLPVLQNIIKVDPELARRDFSRRGPRTTADDIRAIVISPTRELAEQIAVEAKRLVEGTSIVVQTAVGGTQKSAGLRAIQREGCHILVGTPGRLNDIFSDSYSRVEAPDLSAMVYDEADRLLDAGFWREIESIQKNLPDPKQVPRQTLMFSATVPTEVVDLVRRIMRPGFAFEQCVKNDEEPTHANVPQHIVATNGLENQLPAVIELCMRELAKAEQPGNRPFKAIIYFSATNEVALAYDAFRNLSESQEGGSRWGSHPFGRTSVIQIQSRLSQAARTRAADDFRRARSAILLSSDVTARGLDFPEVTHVIQIGVPSNAEQYVHRIGRTARAGKEGEGWLFVDEALQLQTARKLLGRLPIKRDTSLEISSLNLTQPLQVSDNAGKILGMLQKSMANVSPEQKEDTYRSIIGAYRGGASSDNELILKVNDLATYGWGLKQVPSISSSMAQKMGLQRVRGLNISNSRPPSDRGDFGSRGGFGDRRGGFGDRGGYGDRGSFADRGGSRDRGSFGGRDSRSGSPFFGGSRGGSNRSGSGPPRSRSFDSAF